MRRAYAILLALVCALAGALVTAGPAQSRRPDHHQRHAVHGHFGQRPAAHGGGVVGGTLLLVRRGPQRRQHLQVRGRLPLRDLKNWEFRNHVLTQSSASELGTAYIERPKVIYNASTGQFVMWMHRARTASTTARRRPRVAVSSTVDGSYTYQGSFQPLGDNMSRDITTFVDTDGTAYMVSAANENYDLHIYKLTADYTAIDSLVANPWVGGHREAPALFKRNGVYFMLTSAATGWSANQQRYATATSITGPWTAFTNVGDSTAYNSQTAYVLPVTGTSGTSYLYMGDRWERLLRRHRQRLPLRLAAVDLPRPPPRCPWRPWYPEVSIDTAAGLITGTSATYNTLIARNSAKCADVPNQSLWQSIAISQYTCNSGTNQKWWFKDLGT
ncbi:family 43 glycosylhydrolase, partial [Streptomyces sp. L7]